MSRRRRLHPQFNPREYGSSILVTALSAGFGAVMMTAVALLTSGMRSSGADALAAVHTALQVVVWLFLGIALFIGAVVTVNTFGTIIAGRAKRLALLRLLGASARSLRRAEAAEGLAVGLIGSAAGTLVGAGIAQGAIAAAHRWWRLPAAAQAPWFTTDMLAPAIAAALVTLLSAWIGSRRILQIAPIQAFGTAQAAAEPQGAEARRGLHGPVVLAALGCVAMAAGMAIGLASPVGVLVAFPGAVASFVAFMLASDRILPPLIAWGTRRGGAAPARLAARNTARNPRRTSRSSVGIVIGVMSITMFAVAGFTYRDALIGAFTSRFGTTEGQMRQAYDALALPVAIAMALAGFSVLIAAVGLVNSLTLSVLQRRREIGLLRALGLTRRQVRSMSLLECARMSMVAALAGLALGVFYGWVGAVSMVGSIMKSGAHLYPTVPWWLPVGALIGALALTACATLAPSRKAAAVAPTVALAEE